MIKVLFFAQLQELVGKEHVEVEANELKVSDLKQKLQSEYAGLDLSSVMTAINEEYSFDHDVVKTGDTVAFIPPVSGG